ncbi:hypothetical protein [Haloferula rosea]|uniref:Uncharacterized protein n=1 Tax=Haloferula rosea TaxID=490093 RepID=A0A934RD92_9BACT|nr:hypothetical protein [Haloferula rosea]MBK1828593.1 hypothetical protein [Haloferula rosea]
MKPTIILALLAAGLVSCSEKSDTTVTATPETSPELKAVFVDRIPDEASPIHLARTTVQPGDVVVLKGQVMGASEPFVEGRAAFVLGDRDKLTPCNERADDGCKTPWDACCDSKEAFREGTATIQVVGEDGRTLKEGLEGVEGLEKLSRILVKGEVAEQSSAASLIVNATAIQIVE